MRPSVYLERYAYPVNYFDIDRHVGAHIIVVIPCFDEPDLIRTLDSVSLAERPSSVEVSVLIVINHSQKASADLKSRNLGTLHSTDKWIRTRQRSNLKFEVQLVELPPIHAGVGLARKVGMDDALRIFHKSDYDGVILCLDADCTVDNNYFVSISRAFDEASVKGASLHFEHEIDEVGSTTEGIVLYELYLRYYINALKYTRYPMATQTIGSSMAVRASAYERVGGMNRRKAGEDFYFIHKLLPQGGFVEIVDTTVRPSSRVSERVPFGTGAAIGKWLKDKEHLDLVYSPKVFEELHLLIQLLKDGFAQTKSQWEWGLELLSESIQGFLERENVRSSVFEIKQRTASVDAFEKQLWQYFDGLKILKCVHFLSDHHHPRTEIDDALAWLFEVHIKSPQPTTYNATLKKLRKFDKLNAGQIGL